MAPSSTRIRSSRACSNAPARPGWSQSVGPTALPIARLPPDECDDFEMRRPALAGGDSTAGDLQPGPDSETLELLLGEAQVDVPIGLDHAAMAVPVQAGQQQPPAGPQDPHGFGDGLRRV